MTQDHIAEEIRKEIKIINEWEMWSMDKRWTPSWGFGKNKEGKWVVFYVPEGGGRGYEIFYGDSVAACALMIRLEMEDLRLG